MVSSQKSSVCDTFSSLKLRLTLNLEEKGHAELMDVSMSVAPRSGTSIT